MAGGNPQRTHFVPYTELPQIPAGTDIVERFWCYPNPSSGGELTVYFKLGQQAQEVLIELIDQEGRAVFTKRLTSLSVDDTHVTVDTRVLASGIYLCKLQVEGDSGSDTRFFKAGVVH